MGKFGVLRKVGTTILVGAGTFAAKKAGELAADKVRKRFTQEENMCPSCHAPGQTGSFCSNCGNSLTGAPAPIVPAPTPAPTPRPAPTPPPAPAPASVPTPGPQTQVVNGNVVTTFPNGRVVTQYQDGRVVTVDEHGNVTVVGGPTPTAPVVPTPTPTAPVPTPAAHGESWLAKADKIVKKIW